MRRRRRAGPRTADTADDRLTDAARDRRPDAVPGDDRRRRSPRASPAGSRSAASPRSGPTTCASGGSGGTGASTTPRTAAAPGWSCGRSRSRPRSMRSAAPDRCVDPAGPGRRGVPPGARPRPRRRGPHLVLVCPRYEGVDERIRSLVDLELSIGDYVLTGGELPALVVIDAVIRLLPGAIDELSTERGVVRRRAARIPAVHAPADVPRDRTSRRSSPAATTAPSRRWRAEGVAAADARAAPRPARRREPPRAGRASACIDRGDSSPLPSEPSAQRSASAILRRRPIVRPTPESIRSFGCRRRQGTPQ